MANPQHIQWLLEGVESWNARRDQSEFWADFDGANLAEAFQGQSYNPRTIHLGTRLNGVNLSNSLLRQANLNGLGLARAELRNAQFQGARMWSSDLSDAHLTDANFAGSDLLGANLHRAHGDIISFVGANLSGANLEDTKLNRADFTEANLVRAKLRNADLRNASLVSVDITDTQPWQALLYRPPTNAPKLLKTLPDHVDSVGELVEVSRALTDQYATRPEMKHTDHWILFFRGQELTTWELRPSVMRHPQTSEPDVRGVEGEMLLDLMAKRPNEFLQMTSALSQWVLAQHHGLKTRLLDITRNPLVALFSACEQRRTVINTSMEDGLLHVFVVPRYLVKPFDSDTISVIANFAKLSRFEQNLLLGKSEDLTQASRRRSIGLSDRHSDALGRLYDLIAREKPYFKERIDLKDLFRVFIVEPEQSFERIRAQSGAFLLSAFHNRFEPEEIRRWNDDTPVYDHYKFGVRASRKEDILRELTFLNVTREVLFPGLDEATRAVMQRYGR